MTNSQAQILGEKLQNRGFESQWHLIIAVVGGSQKMPGNRTVSFIPIKLSDLNKTKGYINGDCGLLLKSVDDAFA